MNDAYKKIIFSKNTLKAVLAVLAIMLSGFAAWQLLILRIAFDNSQDPSNQVFISSHTKKQETETNYRLYIGKLDLSGAPIILNVDGSNQSKYLKALESGVAHFLGTAYPGQKGNSFIFGHSEYYWNKPGAFKRVFRHLDKLEIGDKIIIKSDKNEYRYKVKEKKIVSPKDTAIIAQTEDYRLTLMTCWPPGTTSKRLVVIAKKIN